MASPVLAEVQPDALPPGTPRDVPLGAAWYRVVRGGVYDDRSLRGGDLVVCTGRGGVGDTVVLVPVGRGEPRFGRVQRDGLHGDAGERCDPVRWAVAGRVVRVVPGHGVPVEKPAPILAFRGLPLRSAQLSLFGA